MGTMLNRVIGFAVFCFRRTLRRLRLGMKCLKIIIHLRTGQTASAVKRCCGN